MTARARTGLRGLLPPVATRLAVPTTEQPGGIECQGGALHLDMIGAVHTAGKSFSHGLCRHRQLA